MRGKAEDSGVRFRPHVKTHKVTEVGRMQHGGGFGPITVSTLAEAEHFAAAGFRDITYAVPIAPEKLPRAAALAARIERLNILLDSFEALRAVESQETVFDAFLEIDCGDHRAGVGADHPESLRLALAIARSPKIRFQGLLTHAGHAYDVTDLAEVRRIAAEEPAALTRFRELAPELASVTRSIGSTPTASVVERFVECDEVRPGNYVFFDAFQAKLGSCRQEDIAVSVLATVVGAYPDRGTMILDAGALAMSKDLSPNHLDPTFGYGVVCDLDLQPLSMKLIGLSQEHGKVRSETMLPIGTRVRVVPNHSCLTAAMYDTFHVVDGGNELVDEWHPVSGW